MTAARPPHPRGNPWVLVAGATIALGLPALSVWRSAVASRPLEEKSALFHRSQSGQARPPSFTVPANWRDAVRERHLDWRPLEPSAPIALGPELFFRSEQLDFFDETRDRGRELSADLDPPAKPRVIAEREGIRITWEPSAPIESLSARLHDDPLLLVRYRIYRWLAEEEPQLIGAVPVSETHFVDDTLPPWSLDLRYCVASALEGRLGDEPTLVDSRWTEVLEVESRRNFDVEVLEGDEKGADTIVSVYRGGRWIRERCHLSAGERVRRFDVAAGEDGPASGSVDVGFQVDSLAVERETIDESVLRPEFLPDGRRKVGPDGNPTFAQQPVEVTLRTIVVRGTDPTGRSHEFRSLPLR